MGLPGRVARAFADSSIHPASIRASTGVRLTLEAIRRPDRRNGIPRPAGCRRSRLPPLQAGNPNLQPGVGLAGTLPGTPLAFERTCKNRGELGEYGYKCDQLLSGKSLS